MTAESKWVETVEQVIDHALGENHEYVLDGEARRFRVMLTVPPTWHIWIRGKQRKSPPPWTT